MKNNVDMVIGGQYGSEGKGKVVQYLTETGDYSAHVRVGSENAGHTIYHNIWEKGEKENKKYKMQVIPCGWVDPHANLYIGAGGLFSLEQLRKELEITGIDPSRLVIDQNAGIIQPHHKETEELLAMGKSIGSTKHGCGAAIADKVMRGDFKTAKDPIMLKQLEDMGTGIGDVRYMLEQEKEILIEGTQGAFLSLNHGSYPYCTSRDILSASLLSDIGLPPKTVRDIYMLVRTYPIRVAGNSGPCYGQELSWEIISSRSGYPSLEERTTVTGNIRRVFELHLEEIRRAVMLNGPTHLVLTFLDYWDHEIRGYRGGWSTFQGLSDEIKKKVYDVATCSKVSMLSTGPEWHDMIDLRNDPRSLTEGGI